MNERPSTPEHRRLLENKGKRVPLEKWGPYVSDRQWGTVREDYSENGDAWNYFPHDHARSRAYRWGEDGIAGISDYFQNICFSIALWNGKDNILKERLFGLTNGQGNHGEDVKELYYYLDNIPSHYYMKMLYKYPQQAFPYDKLIAEDQQRGKELPEYEILDTGIFNDDAYFDVYVEYAKQDSNDIYIRIEIFNRYKESAHLIVLPTLWFYNRWIYGGLKQRPSLQLINNNTVKIIHEKLGDHFLYFQNADERLFTENETNTEKLFNKANAYPFCKDAINDAIVNGKNIDALRKNTSGTKFSPVYNLTLEAFAKHTLYLRLTVANTNEPFAKNFETIFETRKKEADEFYNALLPASSPPEIKNVHRQALAGLLWNKQYYHLDLERWIHESDGITPSSPQRLSGRNYEWKYLKNQDVISMPDKWEYPWYAAWDLGFHCIALAIIDAEFAKNQLIILMREWYTNPEGQMPAYEWNFSDVNPPVHAFAALQVYRMEKHYTGSGDLGFLKRIFQKLIINFTWWTNRKDMNGNNIFEGGFLGLDNIGVFNRSMALMKGVVLEQADATSWMGMYALNLMDIALEIAIQDNSFEDATVKFYEHFVLIAEALNELGLWNTEDNFFYDVLSIDGSELIPLKVRSIVGLTPLFAVSVITPEELEKLQEFKRRLYWFTDYRKANNKYLPEERQSNNDTMLLSLVHQERLVKLLERLLDENEFLSAGGIRALSKIYGDQPYEITILDINYQVKYDPGDSTSDLFGGNSNWRGPVWLPVNYLFIKALEKYGNFYGDSVKVAFPTGSGNYITLTDVAKKLAERLLSIFKTQDGNKPVFGEYNAFYQRPENKDLVLFPEYFHGDTLKGLGASHQTGWTALIADLICSIM